MISNIKFTFKNEKYEPINLNMMSDGLTKDPYMFIYGDSLCSQKIINDLLIRVIKIFSGEPLNLVELFKELPLDSFTIHFLEEGKNFMYYFKLSDDYLKIEEEKFEILKPTKQIIIRRILNQLDESIFGNYFNYSEKRRLLLYAYDLKYDNKKLLVSHLIKRYINIDERSTIFDYVGRCIESIKVVENEILKFGNVNDVGLSNTLTLLSNLDLINSNKYELIDQDFLSLRAKIGRFMYDYLLTELTKYYYDTYNDQFIININNYLYLVKYINDDFYLKEIKLINDNNYLLNELPHTLINLIFNIVNILSSSKPSNFFYENLFENIELRTTSKLITNLKPLLEQSIHKITTTSNNVYLLDLKIFNKNEIVFINNTNNKITLNKLSDYNIRSDKVLTKGYFEGIFDK